MLPDLFAHHLNILFCGTAVGKHSDAVRAHYAKPTNKFWKTLYNIDLTPTRLQPQQYPQLLNYGIGLIDLVEKKSGMDKILKKEDFDRDALHHNISSIIILVFVLSVEQVSLSDGLNVALALQRSSLFIPLDKRTGEKVNSMLEEIVK